MSAAKAPAACSAATEERVRISQGDAAVGFFRMIQEIAKVQKDVLQIARASRRGAETLSVGGDLHINGSLNAGNNTIELRDGCDPGNTSQLSGTLVVQNLTIKSTSGRTFVLPVGANITVLGTLTIEGVPGQPVVLQAASGTAVINRGPGATVNRTARGNDQGTAGRVGPLSCGVGAQ